MGTSNNTVVSCKPFLILQIFRVVMITLFFVVSINLVMSFLTPVDIHPLVLGMILLFNVSPLIILLGKILGDLAAKRRLFKNDAILDFIAIFRGLEIVENEEDEIYFREIRGDYFKSLVSKDIEYKPFTRLKHYDDLLDINIETYSFLGVFQVVKIDTSKETVRYVSRDVEDFKTKLLMFNI